GNQASSGRILQRPGPGGNTHAASADQPAFPLQVPELNPMPHSQRSEPESVQVLTQFQQIQPDGFGYIQPKCYLPRPGIGNHTKLYGVGAQPVRPGFFLPDQGRQRYGSATSLC